MPVPNRPDSNDPEAWFRYNSALVREDREERRLRDSRAQVRRPHRTVHERDIRAGNCPAWVEQAAGGRFPRVW